MAMLRLVDDVACRASPPRRRLEDGRLPVILGIGDCDMRALEIGGAPYPVVTGNVRFGIEQMPHLVG